MRILQISALFEKVGGAEIYAHLLTEALRERGHEVSLFGGSPERAVDEPGVRVVQRPDFSYRTLLQDPELEEAFREHVRIFRPELVHVHNLYCFPATFPSVIAESGVPVVHTPHDYSTVCSNAWCVFPDGSPCEGGPGAKCFQHGCETNAPYDARSVLAAHVRYHLVRRLFRAFVVMSRSFQEKLTANGFESVSVVPHWMDPAEFGGNEAVEAILAGNPREEGHVVFIGRLNREKGLEYLVEAFGVVARELPSARLSLVGEGPQADELVAQAAELGLAERVAFPGKLPREEALAYLARGSVHVQPSIWTENAPISCLESLLFRLPMVASRIGGFPDLVADGETGFLAAPRDAADLAEKILRILRSPELREEMAARCRGRLAEHEKALHLDRIEAAYAEAQVPALGSENASGGGPDDDLLAILLPYHKKFAEVEEWALGLNEHVQYLETGWAGWATSKMGKGLRGLLRRSKT